MNAVNVAVKRWGAPTVCALMGIGWLTAGLAAGDDENGEFSPRTWTDKTGAYKVEASFLDYENGAVRLRKADGAEITSPFERLSVADQNHVRLMLSRRSMARRRQKSRAAQLAKKTKDDRVMDEDQGASAREPTPAESLYGIDWQGAPENALAVAGSGPEKPIMWFRVLGDLDGFM